MELADDLGRWQRSQRDYQRVNSFLTQKTKQRKSKREREVRTLTIPIHSLFERLDAIDALRGTHRRASRFVYLFIFWFWFWGAEWCHVLREWLNFGEFLSFRRNAGEIVRRFLWFLLLFAFNNAAFGVVRARSGIDEFWRNFSLWWSSRVSFFV